MILVALGLTSSLAGCFEDSAAIPVRLKSGPFLAVSPSPMGAAETAPLRFVLANVLSPERSATSYDHFAAYLGERLHQPVTVVRRKTYTELNALLRLGTAQMGLVCAGAYAVGRAEFGLRLLLVPVVSGAITDQSCVIVRRGSGRHSLNDLRGAVFAFTDPLSNSGYLYVAAQVHDRGSTPERYFGRTLFTYSNDSTIQAVRDGIADGGAVDGLVLDSVAREMPVTTREIDVVDQSPAFPNNPIVVSPHAPRGLSKRLSKVLLEMPDDPVGRKVLEQLGCSGFISQRESAYDTIVAGWRELGVLPPAPRGQSQ